MRYAVDLVIEEVIDVRLDILLCLDGSLDITGLGSVIDCAALFGQNSRITGKPAVGLTDQKGFRSAVVMTIEDVQLVAEIELQFVDAVRITVGGLDVLNGAVFHELDDLGNGHLITGKPGIVVDHHADIDGRTDIAEVLHDRLLVRGEIIGENDHDAVCTALCCILAHSDGVEGIITASAADQRNLPIKEGSNMTDYFALLFHVHGYVFTGAAADGDGLGTVVNHPGQVLLHTLFVIALVCIPDGHRCRANTIGLFARFFDVHCIPPEKKCESSARNKF